MDGLGSIVFLILAAIISGISNKAQKKAKAEAAQRRKQSPQPTPEQNFEEMLKKLLGDNMPKSEPAPEFEPEMSTSTEYQDEVEEVTEPTPTHYSETITQKDYELTAEPVTEEKQYPKMEYTPIDSIENADSYNYNEIEKPIELINYDTLSADSYEPMKDTIADSKSQCTEQDESIADDFDPVKAIIYSEIITPKYI